MSAEQSARLALETLRNGTVEAQSRLLESTDPRCKALQENARRKDEGLRMKDEGLRMKDEASWRKDQGLAEASPAAGRRDEEDSSDSSFIPHPSSLRLKPLTARQLTAINLLSLGKSVVAVAASLKVDPSTVHRWKSGNPLFMAELNRRQQDAYEQIAIQLRLTMLQAVQHLAQLMKEGQKSEKREVMWKMLSFLKPAKLIVPQAPTDPRDVVDEKIREGRARRGEIAEVPIEEEERIEWVRQQEEHAGESAVRGRSAPLLSARPSELERGGEETKRRTMQTHHEQGARATEEDASPPAEGALPSSGSKEEQREDEARVAAIGEVLRAVNPGLRFAQTRVKRNAHEASEFDEDPDGNRAHRSHGRADNDFGSAGSDGAGPDPRSPVLKRSAPNAESR